MNVAVDSSALPHAECEGFVIGFDKIARTVALSALIFAEYLARGVSLAITLFVSIVLLATIALAIGRNLTGPFFRGVRKIYFRRATHLPKKSKWRAARSRR